MATEAVDSGIDVFRWNSAVTMGIPTASALDAWVRPTEVSGAIFLAAESQSQWDVSVCVFRLGSLRSFPPNRRISRLLTCGSQDPHSRNDRNV